MKERFAAYGTCAGVCTGHWRNGGLCTTRIPRDVSKMKSTSIDNHVLIAFSALSFSGQETGHERDLKIHLGRITSWNNNSIPTLEPCSILDYTNLSHRLIFLLVSKKTNNNPATYSDLRNLCEYSKMWTKGIKRSKHLLYFIYLSQHLHYSRSRSLSSESIHFVTGSQSKYQPSSLTNSTSLDRGGLYETVSLLKSNSKSSRKCFIRKELPNVKLLILLASR